MRGVSDWLGWAIAVVVAIVIHEYAHARVADALGDPTPRASGRMTLNPLHHVDWLGLLMLVVVRIGWAKPVPINPTYFRDRRSGVLLVSAAGPLSNFATAFVATILLKVIPPLSGLGFLRDLLWLLLQFSVIFGVFNLLPIPPLDGSRILRLFLRGQAARLLWQYEGYGRYVIIILAFTGLLWTIISPIADGVIRLFDVVTAFLG
ncbi:MAG: site-2 protease family protein [Bacillota bacterium]|nr:site-2 protease family protein [Bacillota bacterium]